MHSSRHKPYIVKQGEPKKTDAPTMGLLASSHCEQCTHDGIKVCDASHMGSGLRRGITALLMLMALLLLRS